MALIPGRLLVAAAIGGFACSPLPSQPPGRAQSFEPTAVRAEQERDPIGEFGTLPDQLIEGIRTKSELIRDYSGSPIARQAAAVGLLEVRLRLKGDLTRTQSYPCTAWLIRSDLVLTAYHCLPGIPATLREQGSWELDRATVTFNYDRPQRGEVISVGGVLEANEQLDYAVLRLQRKASETQGVIRLLPKVPPDRTPLFMFHHPYGAPLMVLKDGTCRMTSVAAAEGRFGHQCDTRGGSSGAPVLSYDIGESEDGQPVPVAIGLHTTGLREGLNNPIDVNWATSVRAMVEASSFLASIACEADLSGIACPTLSSMAGSAASPAIVYFDWDSATLTDQARQLLDDLASKISATQVNDIVVSGHTDSVASSSYSVGLSQRMANNVREYLVSRGVPAGKIRTQSFGDSRPMVSVARGVREPNNRRVEVVACEAACP